MVSNSPSLVFQSSIWQYRTSSAPTFNDILKTRNKNQAQKQKQKQTKSQNQSSRNIHHKVTMHAKCLPVQRFGEKASMPHVRPHMNDSKLPIRYALPKKVVVNVYVLRVWRGGRIIGQAQRAYVILENGSAPYVAIRKDKLQMYRKKIASLNPLAIATYSASVEDNFTLFCVLEKNDTQAPSHITTPPETDLCW